MLLTHGKVNDRQHRPLTRNKKYSLNSFGMTAVIPNTVESSSETDSQTEQPVIRKPRGRPPKVPKALSTNIKLTTRRNTHQKAFSTKEKPSTSRRTRQTK